jgi:hypothetical protein
VIDMVLRPTPTGLCAALCGGCEGLRRALEGCCGYETRVVSPVCPSNIGLTLAQAHPGRERSLIP